MQKMDRKIKILQFPIANSNGGITHYAINNWKWMNKDLFQCDFATMSKTLSFADELLEMGSKIHYISCYAEEDEEQFKKEVRNILCEGYDVVHLHTKQWKSFLIEELCIECGVKKIIVHAHSAGIDTLDPVRRTVEEKLHEKTKKRFNHSLATDFWACSQLAADFLYGNQIPKEQIVIMPNAIDLEKFKFNASTREVYRKKYNLENNFVIGNMARMVYQKNQAFLLDVFRDVVRQRPNAKLVILGDGELRDELQGQVIEYGIEDKVLFLGHRDDVEKWYQAMDVFCLSSRFEGLPITAVEAQASGIKCVMSNKITQETNIVGDVIFLELDKDKWVDAILSLGEEDEIKRIYRTERIMNSEYNIGNTIKMLERQYSSINDRSI